VPPLCAHHLLHAAAYAPLSEQLAVPGFLVAVCSLVVAMFGVAVNVWAAKRASPSRRVRSGSVAAIDELREGIEQRLHEALDEAERLRAALAALDGPPNAVRPPRAASARSSEASTSRRRRAPRGSVRRAVLDALADGQAMTLGEVATATGLSRSTVASTLTRLVGGLGKNGTEFGAKRPSVINLERVHRRLAVDRRGQAVALRGLKAPVAGELGDPHQVVA
jgi:DNA-binding transcriptional ArsR family regulator